MAGGGGDAWSHSAVGGGVLGVATEKFMSSAALRLRLRGKAGAFARGAAEATAVAAAEVEGRRGRGGLPLERAVFCSSAPRSWFRAFLTWRIRLSSPAPRRRREERACLRGGEGCVEGRVRLRVLFFFSSSASRLMPISPLSLSFFFSLASVPLSSYYLAQYGCAGRQSGSPAAGALAVALDESECSGVLCVFGFGFGFGFVDIAAGDIGQGRGRGSRPLAAQRPGPSLRIGSGDHSAGRLGERDR